MSDATNSDVDPHRDVTARAAAQACTMTGKENPLEQLDRGIGGSRQLLDRREDSLRQGALQQAPGKLILMLHPAPVRVHSSSAQAIAYTVTHVLVEWFDDDGYQLRWVASWMVR